jgi:cytoskeleton protein RodZ
MTTELTPSTSPSMTAGALLRQYREALGLSVDALAPTLRVPVSKLVALEADRLEDLPDVMFARALALAVCRHLKADAAPVLALLPGQDVSRLAQKNERGLDFPLDRPSFLPQSSFLVVAKLFTPMRWAAVLLLVVALLIGYWPEIHSLLVFKSEPVSSTVVSPADGPLSVTPLAPVPAPAVETTVSGNMVITTVHSAAVPYPAASASAGASAPGVPDAR